MTVSVTPEDAVTDPTLTIIDDGGGFAPTAYNNLIDNPFTSTATETFGPQFAFSGGSDLVELGAFGGRTGPVFFTISCT